MDFKTFFDKIRAAYFQNGFTQDQVDNINLIINTFIGAGFTDARWLAYILATTYHETGAEMRPIEEYGKGRKRTYGQPDRQTGKTYYGRGFVQLTWKENYEKFARRTGLDLVNKPELALEAELAARIMIDGMVKGLFTGKALPDYFPSGGNADWVGARKIVNGTDRAQLISNYALFFYSAINAAGGLTPEKDRRETEGHMETVTDDHGETLETYYPPPQAAPVQSIQRPAEPPAIMRFLTSKIVWTNLVGLVAGGGIIKGIDLTSEQQAAVVQIIGTVTTMATLILRTFFNNRTPKQ